MQTVPKRPLFYAPRPALEAQLGRSLRDHAVTLLAGPAGIGKTSLALEVLARERRPTWRVSTLDEIRPATRTKRAAWTVERVGAVLAAWASAHDAVLFFDDAHRLSDEQIEMLVRVLDAHEGPGRFLFATRRLSRRSQLTAVEIVVPALDDEALAQLARRRSPELGPGEVAEVVARAAGSPWVLLSLLLGRRLDDDVDPLDGLPSKERTLLRDLVAFPDGVDVAHAFVATSDRAGARARALQREGLVVLDGPRMRISPVARATLAMATDPAPHRVNQLALRLLRLLRAGDADTRAAIAALDNDAGRAALARRALAADDVPRAFDHVAPPFGPGLLAMRGRVLVERGDYEEARAVLAMAERDADRMPSSFRRDLGAAYFALGELDRALEYTRDARPGTRAARRHALMALHRMVERAELGAARDAIEVLRADPALDPEGRAECELRGLRLESIVATTPDLLRRVRLLLARCRDLGAPALVTWCAWLEVHCADVGFPGSRAEAPGDSVAAPASASAVPSAMLRLLRELVGREPLPGVFAMSLRPRLHELPVHVAAAVVLVLTRDAVIRADDDETRSVLRDVELVLARVDAAGLTIIAFEVEAAQGILRLLLRRFDDLASSMARLRSMLEPLGRNRFASSIRLLEAAASPRPDVRSLLSMAADANEGPRASVLARALMGHVEPGAHDVVYVTRFAPFVVTVHGKAGAAFEAGLVYDGTTGSLLLEDRTVDLSAHPVVVAILRELFVHGAASKRVLAEKVWAVSKYHPHRDDTRIRVAIRRLRALIEDDASRPRIVCTDGDGYRIAAPLRRWVERKDGAAATS